MCWIELFEWMEFKSPATAQFLSRCDGVIGLVDLTCPDFNPLTSFCISEKQKQDPKGSAFEIQMDPTPPVLLLGTKRDQTQTFQPLSPDCFPINVLLPNEVI